MNKLRNVHLANMQFAYDIAEGNARETRRIYQEYILIVLLL